MFYKYGGDNINSQGYWSGDISHAPIGITILHNKWLCCPLSMYRARERGGGGGGHIPPVCIWSDESGRGENPDRTGLDRPEVVISVSTCRENGS